MVCSWTLFLFHKSGGPNQYLLTHTTFLGVRQSSLSQYSCLSTKGSYRLKYVIAWRGHQLKDCEAIRPVLYSTQAVAYFYPLQPSMSPTKVEICLTCSVHKLQRSRITADRIVAHRRQWWSVEFFLYPSRITCSNSYSVGFYSKQSTAGGITGGLFFKLFSILRSQSGRSLPQR